MGYIKFVLKERRSTEGNTSYARISRIESDMADTGLYELNLILHALSAGGAKPVEDKERGFAYSFSFAFGE